MTAGQHIENSEEFFQHPPLEPERIHTTHEVRISPRGVSVTRRIIHDFEHELPPREAGAKDSVVYKVVGFGRR